MGIKERYARLPPLPPDISRRLEALPSVLVGHPLRLAYLFGSAARDPATASDIDLAVLPADGFSYARLYADLSRALGTDRLDLADMRCASVLLQWEVVATGRLLEAASPEEAAAYERLVAAAVMAQDLSLR
ncbi:MAG: nucleotidyltransferase domain-containing protein, partial [Armatimonadota bacterium]|nr:nucleotidyltransferase domain-containing protein [Armatimonadota bacterium]